MITNNRVMNDAGGQIKAVARVEGDLAVFTWQTEGDTAPDDVNDLDVSMAVCAVGVTGSVRPG